MTTFVIDTELWQFNVSEYQHLLFHITLVKLIFNNIANSSFLSS